VNNVEIQDLTPTPPFGTSPQFWINLQGRYDLDVAEDRNADRIRKEVNPYAA